MLRVVVLGAGRIGKIHAANRRAKLVAVADPFGSAAQDLAADLACEASLAPVALIERDAVVADTPTGTRVDLRLRSVRAVLCGKPIDVCDQRFESFGSGGMLLNENLRPTTERRS